MNFTQLPTWPDIWTRDLERHLGRASAKHLAQAKLYTVGDLLFHFPFRLQKHGELTPISQLQVGEDVSVFAEVIDSQARAMRSRGGHILQVMITDGTAFMSLAFFAKHQHMLDYHQRNLRPGTVALFAGKVGVHQGQLQLSHPAYAPAEEWSNPVAQAMASQPVPVYRATAKMPTWKISKAVGILLDSLQPSDFIDTLPTQLVTDHQLISLPAAFNGIHRPKDQAEYDDALKRFKWEETALIQATLLFQRNSYAQDGAWPMPVNQPEPPEQTKIDRLRQALPFTLTDGQEEVWAEISQDLAGTMPMQRLLQGDVGSGKTVVALLAALQAVDAGAQVAFLAPTEVLANQHYRSIGKLLHAGNMANTTPLLLHTASLPSREKQDTLRFLATGTPGIVVGTHALLSAGVDIPKLALVIVDEQHRFGVAQREALRERATQRPHLLVMTATPIPRTIAMTAFGDLEVSALKQLPVQRAGVQTFFVSHSKPTWVQRVWGRLREEVQKGGRVFVVCPQISQDPGSPLPDSTPDTESTSVQNTAQNSLASVTEVAQKLAQHPQLDQISIAKLHGKLSSVEKQAVLDEFMTGVSPVLVATTVVEVGIDVADATMMIIMDAHRFGISALHQLRGRVGRADKPGICIALSGVEPGSIAFQRLENFAKISDGFVLAELDLQLRDEGDVLGQAQSGHSSSLGLLRAWRDADFIAQVRHQIRQLLKDDPLLTNYPYWQKGAQYLLSSEAGEFLQRS